MKCNSPDYLSIHAQGFRFSGFSPGPVWNWWVCGRGNRTHDLVTRTRHIKYYCLWKARWYWRSVWILCRRLWRRHGGGIEVQWWQFRKIAARHTYTLCSTGITVHGSIRWSWLRRRERKTMWPDHSKFKYSKRQLPRVDAISSRKYQQS